MNNTTVRKIFAPNTTEVLQNLGYNSLTVDFFVPLYLPIVHSLAKIDSQQSTFYKAKEFGC